MDFLISGYFKDDKTTFEDYVVRSSDFDDDSDDEDIFFYGLSEEDIIEAIKLGELFGEDFVISSYEKL